MIGREWTREKHAQAVVARENGADLSLESQDEMLAEIEHTWGVIERLTKEREEFLAEARESTNTIGELRAEIERLKSTKSAALEKYMAEARELRVTVCWAVDRTDLASAPIETVLSLLRRREGGEERAREVAGVFDAAGKVVRDYFVDVQIKDVGARLYEPIEALKSALAAARGTSDPLPNPLLVPLTRYADALDAVSRQEGCGEDTRGKLHEAALLVRSAASGAAGSAFARCCVAAIVFDSTGRLLLVRSKKPGRGWELPGGKVNAGELWREAPTRLQVVAALVGMNGGLTVHGWGLTGGGGPYGQTGLFQEEAINLLRLIAFIDGCLYVSEELEAKAVGDAILREIERVGALRAVQQDAVDADDPAR